MPEQKTLPLPAVPLAALLLLAGACTIEELPEQPRSRDTARAIALLDPDIAPAVAGQDGWNYSQSASVDLNNDGYEERVVLTARADVVRGRPAWDDGQPWQVYIEAADGRRTHVYARRLQLGGLTMRVSAAQLGARPTLVLIEHLPDHFVVYEISYEQPGQVRVVEHFRRALDPTGDLASPRFQ